VVVEAQFDNEAPTDHIDEEQARVPSLGLRAGVVRSVSVPDALRAVVDDCSEPAICMATHARTALSHALFDSVAEEVVRELEVPAVQVGPACSPQQHFNGPLLVAVDGSIASNAIVPIAREWALASAPASCSCTSSILSMSRRRPRPNWSCAPRSKNSRPTLMSRRAWSAATRPPARSALAEDLDPALVALATHGRTGLARAALGSVATSVVRNSACPALVVRPPATDANTTDM
jgi:nucleotide-binding universal stress UspA family protein